MIRSLLLVALVCALASSALAQRPADLQPSQRDARFAVTVDADSHRVVIGAPNADGRLGAVYVFERNASGAWTQTARLTARTRLAGQQFGNAVAIDGDELAIASRQGGQDGGTDVEGGVYRFALENGRWTEQEKLSIGGAVNTIYGAVDLIEGARIAFIAPTLQGRDEAVYVFEPSDAGEWTQSARIEQPPGGPMGFPSAFALSGDRMVIGARNFEGDGGAFTYQLDGAEWAMTAILTRSGARAPVFSTPPRAGRGSSSQFGTAVALDGETVVVGAPSDYDSDAARFTGGAYLFETAAARGGVPWALTARLTPSAAPDANAKFGRAVAVEGSRAVVGATGDDASTGTARGRAYVFDDVEATWAESARLDFPFGTVGDFGTAVALADGSPVVGSRNDGSAFVFAVQQLVDAADGPASGVALSAPSPNPSTGQAALTLTVDAPQTVRVTLHDALGRTVRQLADGPVAASVELAIDVRDLAPGVYVVRAAGETFANTRRLTVAR